MIREIATKKNSMGARGFLLVIIICLMVVLLSMVVGFIQRNLGINHLEYVIYVFLLILGLVLIKMYITQYRYSFINDELIIERLIGNKVMSVVTLRIWNIEYISDYKNADRALLQECDIKKHVVDKKNTWVIIYNSGGKRRAILFNPSKELAESLAKALARKE